MERSAALKNERNPEENFETIIFARNQEIRTGKNKKRKLQKKRIIKESINSEESPLTSQVGHQFILHQTH